MAFSSGSVSFRRFAIVGKVPASIDQELLDKLSSHALRPTELGVPQEIEYGWSGGRHVLDGEFSFENNVFGDALHFALRDGYQQSARRASRSLQNHGGRSGREEQSFGIYQQAAKTRCERCHSAKTRRRASQRQVPAKQIDLDLVGFSQPYALLQRISIGNGTVDGDLRAHVRPEPAADLVGLVSAADSRTQAAAAGL